MSLWITCPLDIKQIIQQYLKFNMQEELKLMFREHFKKLFGDCDNCCRVLDYCDRDAILTDNYVELIGEEENGLYCIDCCEKTYCESCRNFVLQKDLVFPSNLCGECAYYDEDDWCIYCYRPTTYHYDTDNKISICYYCYEDYRSNYASPYMDKDTNYNNWIEAEV